jgi:tetratricopeptide (TPR) repeat protein
VTEPGLEDRDFTVAYGDGAGAGLRGEGKGLPTQEQGESLLDRMMQWEEAYLGGEDPTAETICQDRPELANALRDRIARQKHLYAIMGLRATRGPRPEGDLLPEVPGYEVLRELGRGGMGVVYAARDIRLGRLVALKMLPEARRGPVDPMERFVVEARAVARVQHPNIVAIHGIGEDVKRPYLSLEYVEGGTLAQRLADRPMGVVEAAGMVEVMARAMQAAHDKGIVHRDLKPSNVLLDAAGQPKIGDFGLAKLLDADGGRTLTEQVLGTPSFMAPEQAEGHSKRVGPAADIYALGAILYQALTGRPPFLGGSAVETLKLVTSTDPVAPRRQRPDVSRDLETICLKCLEKEPSKRYRTAAELADDLNRYREGRPIQARPVGPMGRLGRWARRNPALSLAAAVLALTFALGSPTLLALWLRARADRARAMIDRDHAERSRDRALAAVNVLLSAESQETLSPEVIRYRKAIVDAGVQAARDLVAELEGDARAEAQLVDAYSALAEVQSKAGDAAGALETGRKAAELAERLDERERRSIESQFKLARILHRSATVIPDKATALDTIRRSTAILQSLLSRDRDHDRATRLQLIGLNYFNSADYLFGSGRIPEATASMQAAKAAFDEAIGLGRPSLALLDIAAKNLLYLGRAYGDRLDLALPVNRQSVAIYRKLLDDLPDDIATALNLRFAYEELGNKYINARRWGEAIETFETARRMLRSQAGRPGVSVSSLVTLQERLAQLDYNLRDAYANEAVRHAGTMRELTREMYEICERIGALKPLEWNQRIVHAQSAFDEAGYSEEEGHGPDLELLLKSERIWAGIYQQGPTHDLARANLLVVRRKIADVLEERGRSDEAAERRRQSLVTARGRPDLWYDIARGYAWSCGLVGKLPTKLDARRLASQRTQLAAEAIAMLREAVADGFRDVGKLRKEPDFDSIRSLPGIQAIIDDLEFPAEPFATPIPGTK